MSVASMCVNDTRPVWNSECNVRTSCMMCDDVARSESRCYVSTRAGPRVMVLLPPG
ncbi:uncharacterized protein FOMMEDRAFT_16240 [Fomitiporia mediterranea MF3/22]|uniref:uncharacterized protein n=1 Tax=Fomitiporia mediterranea (strain MF3/22) TaxID=694068 RepID=UPI0004408B90|nr:uncharacterized protein FOMMEDRAFT_16240 [Fomitiporia mediterranea MF3/22]EJD07590.1 hypothetical protein FOMMEDRAFT_16240 [Fomitiporia mediterranea MF3/22]